MTKFLDRHFGFALALMLPVAAVIGVVLALGLWELVMVQAYPALMHFIQL